MYLINLLLIVLITTFFNLLIALKLFNKKIDIKNKKNIIALIILILLYALINVLFHNFMRTILMFSALVAFCQYILQDSFYKTIIVASLVFVYYFFGELILSLFLMLVLNVDSEALIAKWVGLFWTDLIVSTIAYGISQVSFVKKFANKIVMITNKPQYLEVVLTLIFGLAVLSNKNGHTLGFNIDYIGNLILLLIFVIIIFSLIREKQNGTNLSKKYEQLFKYIEKYEKELSEKSLCIHEFKNQIIAIKGFTSEKDKKINEYIESIVNDLKKSETIVLKNMENLPRGGLKGLIYYKLGYLQEENINIVLNINPNTKKSPFNKVDPELYNEILKIIGVYIDNAIEATRQAQKKEIALEIYYEKNTFNLILSNTYVGKLDLNILGKGRNSTKGPERGYGLLLVSNILKKNKNITQKTEIINDYFVQYLKIDFKNISKK